MMNRRDILEELAKVVATVSGVKTTARSSTALDIRRWKRSELPLVEIVEPSEEIESDLLSRRSIQNLSTSLKIYFVEWSESPSSAYEALVKAIRNKLGEEFRLSGCTVAVWVGEVTEISGSMPLYNVSLALRLKYYLNQLDN
jgi:hypothetical protein